MFMYLGDSQGEILMQYISVQVNKSWAVHLLCLWNTDLNVIAVAVCFSLQKNTAAQLLFSSNWDIHC